MLVRHGVVGNISACHADARGSIPRVGGFSFSEHFDASEPTGASRYKPRLGGRAVQGASFRY